MIIECHIFRQLFIEVWTIISWQRYKFTLQRTYHSIELELLSKFVLHKVFTNTYGFRLKSLRKWQNFPKFRPKFFSPLISQNYRILISTSSTTKVLYETTKKFGENVSATNLTLFFPCSPKLVLWLHWSTMDYKTVQFCVFIKADVILSHLHPMTCSPPLDFHCERQKGV